MEESAAFQHARSSDGSGKYSSGQNSTDLINMNPRDVTEKPLRKQSRSSLRSQSLSSTRVSKCGSTSLSFNNWIDQKSLRRIQERHSAESYDTRQMYLTVLSNEENFVRGIDQFLNENELLNLRRKELLYKDWQEKIYTPMRRRIEQTIEEGYPRLDEKKREEYLKYLSYRNKKGHVFLDVISQDEYDALSLFHSNSPALLRAESARALDPLLLQERKKLGEERIALHCKTGKVYSDDLIRQKLLPPLPLRPLGRHGTNCNTWLEMPLRNMESPIRSRSRKRMKGTINNETFKFGSWGQMDQDNNEIVKQELRIQRRRRFPLPSTTPTNFEEIKTPATPAVPIMEKPRVTFSLP